MNQDELITLLKEQYSRTLRKQLIKTILENEKNGDKVLQDKNYNTINQIFSYVLHNCNWNIADNANNWDDTPLEIMIQVFPQIETTDWYKNQKLTSTQSIDVVIGDDSK
jgi:uncharacterized protein (UPF0297 family)